MSVEDVIQDIAQSITRLTDQPAFSEWLKTVSVEAEDYVVINNSFVYRNVSTVKSEKYLVLQVDEDKSLRPRPSIATDLRINLDFKHLGHKIPKPPIQSLEDAVDNELDNLGQLLFILIGGIEDATVLAESVGHADYDTIYWDPRATEPVQIEGREITVRDTHDEEPLAEAIATYYQAKETELPGGLIEALGIALDQLQDRAVASLLLPSKGSEIGTGMTDSILAVLNEQRSQYADALQQTSIEELSGGMNEILRIAYNFASDATTYLSLIVSICDLKPIVLWGTIAEHNALSEAFKGLPWSRSRNKPSLKNYSATISDARNSAFHNLFPFRKSLHLALPESALHDAELRIFSEHGRKKENRLSFQDRELVDLLVEFTRARDRQVPPRFWRQNLVVMDATIELFSATNSFLKRLHEVRVN
ncbi:MAG TPA: hypothetical protein DCK93_18505 [Blastocatellia bacterium]|jgi:hypothetical protein|nr:hypothetical protein [Blastocatellia bacterium]